MWIQFINIETEMTIQSWHSDNTPFLPRMGESIKFNGDTEIYTVVAILHNYELDEHITIGVKPLK